MSGSMDNARSFAKMEARPVNGKCRNRAEELASEPETPIERAQAA